MTSNRSTSRLAMCIAVTAISGLAWLGLAREAMGSWTCPDTIHVRKLCIARVPCPGGKWVNCTPARIPENDFFGSLKVAGSGTQTYSDDTMALCYTEYDCVQNAN